MRRRGEPLGPVGLAMLSAIARRKHRAALDVPREERRVIDRQGGLFGLGGGGRLKPVGRPGDIYGDVMVSVAAVRFGRAA